MEIERAKSMIKALKSQVYMMCIVDFDIEDMNTPNVPYKTARVGVVLSVASTPNGPEFREITTKYRYMTYSKIIGTKNREDTLARVLAKRYKEVKLRAAGREDVSKLINEALNDRLTNFAIANKRQINTVLNDVTYTFLGPREINASTGTSEKAQEETDKAEELQDAANEVVAEQEQESNDNIDEAQEYADTEEATSEELVEHDDVEKVVENYTVCGKLSPDIDELKRQAKEGGYGCEACGYTGWQFTTLGLKVKCTCQDKAKYNKEPPKQKLDIKAIVKDGELAVVNHIIPEERRFDEFDPDYCKRQAALVARSCGCNIVNFDQVYLPTLNEIMGKLMTGTLKQSYIIGAPNGFGKTTFVMTCLKRLHNMGKKVVPYKSLRELAEIQEDDNNRVMRRMAYARKGKNADIEEPKYKKPLFTWREYMESDILFTFLTTSENRWIESSTLKGIIEERAVWGRPVIVMTSSSVKLYTADRELKKNFWDDILAYGGMQGSNDRLIHRSCFKQYKSAIIAKAGEDY